MPNVIPIDALADPRIADYRDLKDRELSRAGGKFIAEGEWVVRRLLASAYAADSVLLAERVAAELSPLVPPHVPVYVAPAELVSRIVGFRFHSGVIAVGRRSPTLTLAEWLPRLGPTATLVVLPEITSTENLGGLLRIAAGFGTDGVLLGPRCCDPFYRQAVRVSMGTVFKLALIHSADLDADLHQLGQTGFERIATVLDPAAQPLATTPRRPRIALLLGNEAQGLSPRHTALCDRRVTIPMRLGTDSLNVTVAAGIFLYHFCDVAAG